MTSNNWLMKAKVANLRVRNLIDGRYSGDKPGDGGIDIGMEPQRESGLGTEGGLVGLAAYTVSSAVHMLT